MNILYISPMVIDLKNLDGVARKLLYQCNALGSIDEGDRIWLASFFADDYYAVRGTGYEKALPFVDKGSKQLNMFQIYPQLSSVCEELEIDAVYFRMMSLSWVTERLFKELRKKDIRIVVEIPTYPFWKEKWLDVWDHIQSGQIRTGIKRSVSNVVYWLYTFKLKRHITAIVTFSDIQKLWGVRVIKIANGYHFVLPTNARAIKSESEHVNLLLVASVRNNHGADRVIAGMLKYYQNKPKRDVVFHIIGDGSAIPSLKEMVERDKALKDHVVFHGFKSGDALDKMYALGDIGVSALAFHRLGVAYCSPLKSKEYFAKGLPVIGTTAEMDITQTECGAYFLAMPADDSPIDMDAVLSFYDGLSSKGVTDYEIIATAAKYYDWKNIMRPIHMVLKGQG